MYRYNMFIIWVDVHNEFMFMVYDDGTKMIKKKGEKKEDVCIYRNLIYNLSLNLEDN